MKSKIFLIGVAAAMLLTVPLGARAADLPQPAYKAPPYVAPVYATWSGFYVGINGGYGWGKADLSTPSGGTFTSSTEDGELAGVTLGYNFQTGTWVWGLEGDIDYAWIKGNVENSICAGGACGDVKNTFLGTARARIGYAGWNNWMPYLTGGAAFGTSKIEAPSGASSSKTNFGWTAGAGVEYSFLGPWSAKLEYLYADLGSGECDSSTCGVTIDYSTKINVIRVGVNYRF